jgi:lysophospholipid acyltransferase (LPLAT)-like uncharacterized protein
VKIRSIFLTRCLAWLCVQAGHLLFRTCRVVYLAPEPWLRLDHRAADDDPRRGVLCVWHDVLIIPTFAALEANRGRNCCLVSKHQDGSYLAEAMAFLDYGTVRGSTQRGGAGAVKQLIADTAGKHIVITPDGPRGPRRQLKPGAVFVASQTRKVICPGAYACKSAWKIQGSWTDMVIPKPFTTIYAVTGHAIAVPPDLSRDQLQEYLRLVQSAMDHLSDQVERLARGEIDRIEFHPPASAHRAAA